MKFDILLTWKTRGIQTGWNLGFVTHSCIGIYCLPSNVWFYSPLHASECILTLPKMARVGLECIIFWRSLLLCWINATPFSWFLLICLLLSALTINLCHLITDPFCHGTVILWHSKLQSLVLLLRGMLNILPKQGTQLAANLSNLYNQSINSQDFIEFAACHIFTFLCV